jgi:AraC-like DNA-binding protein/quercetin dioxygenase-like cupin family protein
MDSYDQQTSQSHAASGAVQPAPHFAVKTEVHSPGVISQHSHPHFETLLLLSGNRVQHLGLRDIEARRGHLLFMPPEVPHGATLQTENVSLLLSFNLAFLRPELPVDAAGAWDRPATLAAVPELLPFVAQSQLDIRCDVQLTKRLCDMSTDLRARTDSPSLGAMAFARAQLSLLLLEVVRAFERPLLEATARMHNGVTNTNRMDQLFAFLRNHLAERVSINDAAKHLNASSSCLTARIKRVTGKTFGELLLEMRLLRAKELLLYSDHRISQIAYTCGFDDHAYFSRRFHQIIGVSPLDYRHKHAFSPEPIHQPAAAQRDDKKRKSPGKIVALYDAQRRQGTPS